jgi:3-methyl-2-oxobutanoate hydroxymethyltransferase
MNILDWQTKHQQQQKITVVTCYDYCSAQIVASTKIDAILVGDTLAMVMYGHATTIPATVEMMVLHTAAVARGAKNKFIIGDLPFLSYRQGLTQAMQTVQRFMVAGAQAIKLEGTVGNLELIKHVVASGVPVMGHIGMTPQSVHQLGGFKVQAKHKKAQDQLLQHALQLQDAGCFAIVLECVPSDAAKAVTEKLDVPTIGIGAGPDTSGQVIVWHDMLGLYKDFKPKFVKKYLNGFELMQQALNDYDADVKAKVFPNVEEHCY